MASDPQKLAELRAMVAQAETTPAPPSEPRGDRSREEPVLQITDEDDAVRRAAAFILKSTNNRPQTESEIRAKLTTREYPVEVIDAACAHARAVGALDDQALAHALVSERGERSGWGRSRIAAELDRRGIPAHVADTALAVLDDRDDLAVATELARKRLRQLPSSLQPEAVARRLAGYLTRRGHPPGLAQRVAREVSGLNHQWD